MLYADINVTTALFPVFRALPFAALFLGAALSSTFGLRGWGNGLLAYRSHSLGQDLGQRGGERLGLGYSRRCGG